MRFELVLDEYVSRFGVGEIDDSPRTIVEWNLDCLFLKTCLAKKINAFVPVEKPR